MEQHPHPPSLCLLFQKGRCNSQTLCNQVHVDRNFAHAIHRSLLSGSLSNCCRLHGDIPSNNSPHMATLMDREVLVEREGLPPMEVPQERMCMTMYWTRVPKHKRRQLIVPADRVCNLHQVNACKFGVECRNIHVCRELIAQADPPMRQASAPAMSPVPPPPPPPVTSPVPPRRAPRALAIVDPVSMQPVEVAPQLSRPPPLVADPLTDAANAPPSLPFPILAAGWGSPILSSPLTAEKPPLSGTEGGNSRSHAKRLLDPSSILSVTPTRPRTRTTSGLWHRS
eukprot:TRINITY_DN1739_c0_g1_i1.p2 TRINITY_DN1739_c0_g1~~TRINITY_DN1739_c0_g1_i1.p2  ORF type:complete len:283 (+),score=39.17 TRINITY_DN1739_c0_g1_i1:309-1157(+)